MNCRRFARVLIAAFGLAASVAIFSASASAGHGYYGGRPGLYYPMGEGWDYYGYDYNPYVVPLPAFGILPVPAPPKLLYHRPDYGMRAPEIYLYQPDAPVQKRPLRSSVVPYEKPAEERLLDLRRVRFEITVPYADAVVLFDGVKTKQTGTKRVFFTPPMEEDKTYSVTIAVQWTKDDGTPSLPRSKTFTVKAGETVRHTFIE